MCRVSALLYSAVKYHSEQLHNLTCPVKTDGDSIWWAVLVGRYPRLWRPGVYRCTEKNNKGDFPPQGGSKISYMLETLCL